MTFKGIRIPDIEYEDRNHWIHFFNNHNNANKTGELSIEATGNIEEQQNLAEMTPELWEVRLSEEILEESQDDDDDDDDDNNEGGLHLQFFDAPMEISMDDIEEENEFFDAESELIIGAE